MTIFKSSLLTIAMLLTLGLHTIPAQATALRTFVSSTGNDANTASSCSATAPCRTLAAAFSVTQAKGHIFMTDVAGYGSLTITRSVTLVAIDGALIGVPSLGTGITIDAGVNDEVTIDGLTIDGAGVGLQGIRFNTGKSLTITRSVIRNLTSSGISFHPNASSALQVSNTVIAKSSFAIAIAPTGSGTVNAILSRVEFYNNDTGIDLNTGGSTGFITAVVADSVAANNGTGFDLTTNLAPSRLVLIRTVAANNVTAISALGANATLLIGQSTLTGNQHSGFAFSGAIVRSYGDNNIDGNDDGDPPPIIIAKK